MWIRGFVGPKIQYVRGELRTLFRSRIFQLMLTIPCLFITLKSYLFFKAMYDDYKPEEGDGGKKATTKFVKPKESYWNQFREQTADVVHALLTDPTIEKEGLNFLTMAFTHDQTKEAGLVLLTQVFKDPRFIHEGKVFGVELIEWVLRQPSIEQDFKTLVLRVLDSKEVKDETVNVLDYIVSQKKSEDMLARYLNATFLRPDILDNLTVLLTASVCNTIADERTQKLIENFAL